MDESIKRIDRLAYAVGWMSESINTLLKHRDEDGNIKAEYIDQMVNGLRILKENVGEGTLTKELEEIL